MQLILSEDDLARAYKHAASSEVTFDMLTPEAQKAALAVGKSGDVFFRSNADHEKIKLLPLPQ